MKIAALVARVLLGLLFVASGISGFFIHPPAMPGMAGAFQDVFFRSHYVLFVDGIELLAGLMLLTNRFVPLGLTILAGIIYNILVFHITMQPMGIVAGIVATLLWGLAARPFWSYFSPLFVPRALAELQ